MHQIVSSRPEWIEFQKRKAKARADRDEFVAEAKRRQQAYELAAVEALDKGSRIPEAPQDGTAGDRALAIQLERIAAEERAWIVENVAGFEAEFYDREDEMIAEAAKHLTALDALVEEAGNMRAGLAYMRREAGGENAWGRCGTNLGLLVDCARNDRRLFREPYAVEFQRTGVR